MNYSINLVFELIKKESYNLTFKIQTIRFENYLHSMAFSRDLKVLGRPRKKFCMLLSASMAVPSTTSIMHRPRRLGTRLADAV